MGQLGIWVFIPPLPPFFSKQLIQRIYLGLNLGAVSLSLQICGTSWQDKQNYASNHVFIYFLPSDIQSFGAELNRPSKMAHADIWGH